MNQKVPSFPRLVRLIRRALWVAVPCLLLGAALLPAPLEKLADPASPPNPAKSAWFLLWIQEIVSHGTVWIYPVLAGALLLIALPWLRPGAAERAAWFQPGERLLGVTIVAVVLAVVILTLVALFLRGPDWQLTPWV